MKHDIRKLAAWLENVCRQGMSAEREIYLNKLSADKTKQSSTAKAT